MAGQRSDKTALIVAPHFPPSALPPSHRARQFATYLPHYGWRVIVLTVRPEYYQEPLEPELCGLVPPEVEVIRTAAIPPKRPAGWGIGDLGARALLHHGRALTRLCRRRAPDLVYFLCPPNHQLVLGRLVCQRFGVPYVFDYIDPWVSDWLRDHARPFTKLWLAHVLARWLEPIAIRRVLAITSVSAGTNEGLLRRYHHLSGDAALALPYGAEPDVFEYVRTRARPSPPPPDQEARTLLYLGAMWDAARETLLSFLAALRLVKQRRPDLYRRCRIQFVGTSYRPNPDGHFQVRPIAEQAGVAEVVTEQPRRLPFLDSIALLRRADGLLMLGSSEAHYTASRLLPYLFARRPVLAVFHEASDATSLLRRREGVCLVVYGDSMPAAARVEDVYAALVDFLTRDREADLPALDGDPNWERYTARALTGELATFLDRIIAREGSGARRRRPGRRPPRYSVLGLSLRSHLRFLLMPGFDLFTRKRVRLARYWRNGPRRVLDAGLGNGWFSYLAYRSGATVVAVSNEVGQVEKARQFYNRWLGVPEQRLAFRQMDLRELDRFDEQSFDEILCYETLEHILDDAGVCRQFHRLLAARGDLHLCCPNAEHPRWAAEPLDGNGQWGGHVRAGYTLASFLRMLEPLGFQLTASAGLGGPMLVTADRLLQRLRGRAGDLLASPLASAFLPLVAIDPSCPRVPYCVFVRFRKAGAGATN